MSKKLSTIKVASAAFAGLLVLSSGLAAGAHDGAVQDPAEVVSGSTEDSLVADPGTDVEDDGDVTVGDGDDVTVGDGAGEVGDEKGDEVGDDTGGAADEKPVVDDGQGDGDDSGVIEITDDGGDVTVGDGDQGDDLGEAESPTHPENHGALVSAVAKNNAKDAAAGGGRNHGEAVSAAAHSGKPAHDGDDALPAEDPGTPPTIDDDDDDQDEVEVDDDDQDDDDEGDKNGRHHGNPGGVDEDEG